MTGRRIFHLFRWAALGAVAPALWACNSRTLEKPTLEADQTFVKTFAQSINRNVDLLFMVDNSMSMKPLQKNLLDNFPTFMTTLQGAPQGLPNIHVAVVSSDMGAGDGAIGDCAATPPNGYAGNNGVFQYKVPPGSTCTATGLQPDATFISNVAGQANYTGNLADVFTCIAALGDKGCGFEHQFASVLRALGADGLGPPPAENQGFLRKEAYLVVIMITNEDDCSAPPGVALFDTSANRVMGDQLGPITNFRCNEFGHLCKRGGATTAAHPDRNAPNLDPAATVDYDSCISNDTEGFVLGVQDTADKIKRLKDDPSMVLFAAITGAPTPYQVHWKPSTDTSCNMNGQTCPYPEITHSCTATAGPAMGSYADPGVRVAQLVGKFGGLVLSICDDSFAPSLDKIAQLINKNLEPPCIAQAIANKPGTTDPDCTVVSHMSNGTGGSNQAAVPYCGANGGAAPCWQLRADTCPDGTPGQIVDISQDPTASTETALNATVNCSLVTP